MVRVFVVKQNDCLNDPTCDWQTGAKANPVDQVGCRVGQGEVPGLAEVHQVRLDDVEVAGEGKGVQSHKRLQVGLKGENTASSTDGH